MQAIETIDIYDTVLTAIKLGLGLRSGFFLQIADIQGTVAS